MHSTVSLHGERRRRGWPRCSSPCATKGRTRSEAVLVVVPHTPDRERVGSARPGDRDHPVVPVDGEALGRPLPREWLPVGRVDAVLGHVRTLGGWCRHRPRLRRRPTANRRSRRAMDGRHEARPVQHQHGAVQPARGAGGGGARGRGGRLRVAVGGRARRAARPAGAAVADGPAGSGARPAARPDVGGRGHDARSVSPPAS